MFTRSLRAVALLLSAAVLQSTAVTLFLAGDSTMADFGTTSETEKQGWGVFLNYSMKGIKVVDKGLSGRSVRSYTREGVFTTIYNSLSSGDYVVIEFGHNDAKTDGGRWCCSGTGSELCYEYYDGVNETVYTFPTYIRNATTLLRSKGATVLISSMTPRIPSSAFSTGTFVYTPDSMVKMAKVSAEMVGATYVDHGYYTAAYYSNLTHSAVKALFATNDTTHTNPKGAAVVAKTFVRALNCSSSSLNSYVKNTTILGHCLPANSTNSSNSTKSSNSTSSSNSSTPAKNSSSSSNKSTGGISSSSSAISSANPSSSSKEIAQVSDNSMSASESSSTVTTEISSLASSADVAESTLSPASACVPFIFSLIALLLLPILA